MPTADQFISEQRFFGMFVSRSGAGKSTAAASFPKPYNQLDFDLRFGGVKNAINQGIIDSSGIEYEPFSPKGGWEPVERWLAQQTQNRVSGNFRYKTIEVASLTNLARVFMNYSRKMTGGKIIGGVKQKDTLGNVVIKGGLRMPGPSDWNVERVATHDFFDELRTFPCNIIVSAHIIDKWGRPNKSDDNEYAPSELIGEKISVTENLAENVLTYFDNVFRFSRDIVNNEARFYVEFCTDLAKNAYGIPPGKYDITGKQFYPFFMELVEKYKKKN